MENDIHQNALTLGQEGAVKKEEVAKGERAIPVTEDPNLVSVSEDIPARFTQQGEQQGHPVIAVLSVSMDREHTSLSDGAALQGRVQNSPLALLGGRDGKQRSMLSVWLPVLLVALIFVGVVSWLLFLQLFLTTDPWQSFNDTKLGFSVRYPTDWLVQVDHTKSVVHFHDSTQTGQVDIAISSGAIANDRGQFLQQQASQLGITNVTTMPSRSFAGASWQQVQGKLSQERVNYSVTMLTTIYSNHFYLLIQRSPQSTYSDEEAVIFSVMRASFHFS